MKYKNMHRQELLEKLFQNQVPRLWCPPLTHFTSDGSFDKERISAHWRWMHAHVKAFLVPGSTGEG